MEFGPKQLTELSVLVEALESRLDLLVVCLSHSWGGLEQVAASDALEVGALGLKTRVLVLDGTPIHRHLADREEVRVIPLASQPRNYFDLKMRSDLKRLIENGVNLIHTHQPSLLGSILPWVGRKSGVGVIATRHIMNNHQKKDFIHRAIYSRLDALLVISQTLRQNVLETHAIRDRKVKVVHLGLDFDRFDPRLVDAQAQRARWGADPDSIVVGLVGRIDPAKGQGTFIKAAAGLLKTIRPQEKLKFVIVGEETLGSESTYLKELQAMVAQFRLEEHVIFAGFQKNVPEVMRAFDIFVMPSRQEAFGLVAIEAMAMACPVIISQGGSAEEIVGTGGALLSSSGTSAAVSASAETSRRFGLIMRPDDAFDLQQQLRYLLDHPEERLQMGQRAREHVVNSFDRKNRLRRTLEIYERTLRRRRTI